MQHIDVFCHFFPQGIFKKLSETTGGTRDIGKRIQGVRTIYDLDARFRIMDGFENYSQVLSLGLPPIEGMVGPDQAPEFARVANDGLAELCAKYPDRFCGYVGGLPMNAPDEAAKEAERILIAAMPTVSSSTPTSTACVSTSRSSFRSSRSRRKPTSRSVCIRRVPLRSPISQRRRITLRNLDHFRLALRDQRHHGAADLLRRDDAPARPESDGAPPRRHDFVFRPAHRDRLGDARQPHFRRGLQRRA